MFQSEKQSNQEGYFIISFVIRDRKKKFDRNSNYKEFELYSFYCMHIITDVHLNESVFKFPVYGPYHYVS